MSELPSVVEALSISAGDTLVLRLGRNTPAGVLAHVKALVEERLPGVTCLLVAADQMAVYHPEVQS